MFVLFLLALNQGFYLLRYNEINFSNAFCTERQSKMNRFHPILMSGGEEMNYKLSYLLSPKTIALFHWIKRKKRQACLLKEIQQQLGKLKHTVKLHKSLLQEPFTCQSFRRSSGPAG